MNKIEEIFKSWSISINPSDKQYSKAVERMMICNDCKYKKTSDFGVLCGVCGCLLKLKIYTPMDNGCPKKKW